MTSGEAEEDSRESTKDLLASGALLSSFILRYSKILSSGEAEEDFRGVATCFVGNKDENKLREAIALSEENENDEEELLRQAIALSLED